MKKLKLLLPLLCVGLVVTGCGKTIPTLEDGKQVIAELEGKKITVEDLYSELKSQGGTSVLVNLIDVLSFLTSLFTFILILAIF